MNINIIIANSNGNNFVLMKNVPKNLLTNDKIKNICKDYKTDGLIILDTLDTKKLSMNYYNNDGSWETLCVNGLLCAGKLLNSIYKKNNFEIQSANQCYKIYVKNDSIKISMPKPEYKSQKIITNNFEGYYIDSGAKHFVINQKTSWPNKDKIIEISRKIRYDQDLFPDGINVNFYKIINHNTLEIKTYEKGIENIMESCASGSFACAFHYHFNNKVKSLINIINEGGNYLSTFNEKYSNNAIISNSIIEYEDNIIL